MKQQKTASLFKNIYGRRKTNYAVLILLRAMRRINQASKQLIACLVKEIKIKIKVEIKVQTKNKVKV